jgi:group I intron endonuclease
MIGIYKITNINNNKYYIGQVGKGKNKTFQIRFKEHISALKNNKHINKHLQLAWNKYGENNFKFEIVEECSREQLNDREKYWIKYLNSNNKDYGYNKTPGGDGTCCFGKDNGMFGKHHSLESKHKISINKCGKITWMKGKKHSTESKIKISNSKKGQIPWSKGVPATNEQKIKQSEKMKGKPSGFKDKKHSDEVKNKISIKNKGRKSHRKIELNDIQINDIITRYNNKEYIQDIAKIYNCHRKTMSLIIKQHII